MAKPKLPPKDFKWTPRLAYAVGLLVTDGCLSKDGRHIAMRSTDKEQLQTFKACLALKNRIRDRDKKNCYTLQFGNIQFYNWLLKIGLSPAKTYSIGTINIPDRYFRDFLRGHFDGDGSVQVYLDKYNSYKGRNYTAQRIFVRFISASRKHMVWLHRKIAKLVKVKGAFIKEKPKTEKHVPIWELKFAKKESVRLLKWMYYRPNLPSLSRKRTLAMNTINKIAHEKRRVYTRISK